MAFARRADGSAQGADPARGSHAIEMRLILAVVVADEVPRALVEGRGLAQLLGDPGVGRVPRDADVDHPPRAERDHEEGVERAEAQVGDREEVAGPDVRGVVPQEGRSRLAARARDAGDGQVGLDRPLGDAEPQLLEFAADPLGPQSAFSAAILRIKVTVSADSGGRPGPGSDFRRQRARNPARCQRSSVSG